MAEPVDGLPSSDAPPPTLVVGLGNPLRGDDGVGVRVVQQLTAHTLPAGVEVLDAGTRGLDLVAMMPGRQRVILVDAARMGRRPGEFVRVSLDRVRLQGADGPLSVHTAGLSEALLLAQALRVLPPEIVVFGVEPAATGWGSALSAQVEAALPDVLSAVLHEIHAGPPTPHS